MANAYQNDFDIASQKSEEIKTIPMIASRKPGESLRYNSGKPMLSFVPDFLLKGLARVLEYGRIKYARGNWLKGAPATDQIDSLRRHMQYVLLYLETQQDPRLLYDVESWLPHVDHMIFNCISLRLSLMNDPNVQIKGDPGFNPKPAKTKSEIDVKSFLEFMEKQHPGAASHWLNDILAEEYNYHKEDDK